MSHRLLPVVMVACCAASALHAKSFEVQALDVKFTVPPGHRLVTEQHSPKAFMALNFRYLGWNDDLRHPGPRIFHETRLQELSITGRQEGDAVHVHLGAGTLQLTKKEALEFTGHTHPPLFRLTGAGYFFTLCFQDERGVRTYANLDYFTCAEGEDTLKLAAQPGLTDAVVAKFDGLPLDLGCVPGDQGSATLVVKNPTSGLETEVDFWRSRPAVRQAAFTTLHAETR